MVKQQERELTPEELAGPVTKETYWLRALHFVRSNNIERPPFITLKHPAFRSWQQYFQRHLGWTPWILKALLTEQRSEMTVPCEIPSWFDPSFIEDANWRPIKPYKPQPTGPMLIANLFVPAGFPHYDELVAMHNAVDNPPSYFGSEVCKADGVKRDGIWVPLNWLPDRRRGASAPRVPNFTPSPELLAAMGVKTEAA